MPRKPAIAKPDPFKPSTEITDFKSFDTFLKNIFVCDALIKDCEYVTKAKHDIYRATFNAGPFREYSIHWEIQSSQFTRKIKANVMLNSILGALSANEAFYLDVINGSIKIKKAIEVMG